MPPFLFGGLPVARGCSLLLQLVSRDGAAAGVLGMVGTGRAGRGAGDSPIEQVLGWQRDCPVVFAANIVSEIRSVGEMYKKRLGSTLRHGVSCEVVWGRDRS